ncbi:unnamed protein product [Effrenium voratum]|uniref:Uncharacterized protein n=1 Tax=Effrenium voratum TaxID=2562239 RepID=A0AA36IGA0_9DINO|nr:unnamed protein product [Effrenium voratum]CAJ1386185.1 unnamed protein product [Effrenium voratum]
MPKPPLAKRPATTNSVPSKVHARSLDHAIEILSAKVRRLDLRYRKIGDRGAERLSEVLLENSTLTRLELDFNGLTSGGAARLAEALTKNSTLTHLYLCNNIIDDEGAYHLASVIGRSGLVELGLAGNRITARGAEAILEALRSSGAVVGVDLSLQTVPDDLVQDIRAAMVANHTAKVEAAKEAAKEAQEQAWQIT